MILGLGISIIVLVLAGWLVSMYAGWKLSKGATPQPLPTDKLVTATDKTVRLTRRGWYIARMKLQKLRTILVEYIQRGFLKVFPAARVAFQQKELASTEQAPSPFLQEVAAAKRRAETRLPKSKKML